MSVQEIADDLVVNLKQQGVGVAVVGGGRPTSMLSSPFAPALPLALWFCHQLPSRLSPRGSLGFLT